MFRSVLDIQTAARHERSMFRSVLDIQMPAWAAVREDNICESHARVLNQLNTCLSGYPLILRTFGHMHLYTSLCEWVEPDIAYGNHMLSQQGIAQREYNRNGLNDCWSAPLELMLEQ